jgi:hypothetical protein
MKLLTKEIEKFNLAEYRRKGYKILGSYAYYSKKGISQVIDILHLLPRLCFFVIIPGRRVHSKDQRIC